MKCPRRSGEGGLWFKPGAEGGVRPLEVAQQKDRAREVARRESWKDCTVDPGWTERDAAEGAPGAAVLRHRLGACVSETETSPNPPAGREGRRA